MKLALAAVILALSVLSAQARPSPYPPVTQYDGDRISARQVVQIQRHAKRHRHYRHHSRQRAPVVRQIAAAEGMTRQVGRVAHGRPRAWCGWYLSRLLGMPLRSLWLARNWASVGSSAGQPQVGAIVVWRHHVGLITGHSAKGWIVKSGNDGHRVRERPRSLAHAIAFRRV